MLRARRLAQTKSKQANLKKERVAAKKMLRDETLDLVALATEKVVSKTVSDGVDANLIKASLKEAGER